MRKDTRPALLASKIAACDLEIRPGEKASIVCPDCGTWRLISERRIFPHSAENGRRCNGSGRRVFLDVPLASIETRQSSELAEAAGRRSTRVQLKPAAPVAPAVAYLNRDRTPRHTQTAGWPDPRTA
jgi:predicted RNA-binding Zn-ribbon protein involved in translation (DUF1610 family)